MTDFLWTRPVGPEIGTMLLAHGSGAAMDSPFLERMTKALNDVGFTVARFEFAYMAKRRVEPKKPLPPAAEKLVAEYRYAIRQLMETDGLAYPVLIGGKSLGGRVAVMTGATELPIPDLGPITGVVCFGYPFHPTGDPEKLRLQPLKDCKLPLLICQGDRDDFGNRTEVEAMELPEGLEIVWLEDGSHDFGPRGQSGATLSGNIAQAAAAAAEFVRRFASGENGAGFP
jgi:predicted alpha/beta-hydrolase family hydrolase